MHVEQTPAPRGRALRGHPPELLSFPPRRDGCAPEAAFVTVLSNESYLPGALCLARSMELAASRCPFLLVVDDLEGASFSSSAIARLHSAFGAGSLVKLSHLYDRVLQFSNQTAAAFSTSTIAVSDASTKRGASRGRRLSSASALSRLPRAAAWGSKTHQKLLVWALPGLRRAVFLDLDLLVLRNIDALTLEAPGLEGEALFSAVAALPYSTKFFNSGVFLFAPSLTTAAALLDLSRRATFGGRSPKATGRTASVSRPIRVQPALEKFHL